MAYKNLGPEVSESPADAVAGAGQYTADEHSFESLVFQQDKPVLDWELNLLQEVLGQAGSRLMALKTLPSSVLNGDFLEDPGLQSSYGFLGTSYTSVTTEFANKFNIRAVDLVVNGWPVRFEYTDSATPGENIITLPGPPGSGARTDLVILEVWRALVSAAPSTLNKSLTGQVLRNGNAKAADQFPPGNVNLVDDLLDPSMLVETQKRVQVQYRYRVVQNVTIDSSNIDGFGTLLSRSVPYQNASTVDGEPPISPLPYVSASSKSYGLWIAGNGNATSAAALGTVDGFMYAVPLCAVYRRNSGGFSETTNRNGALPFTAGTSDRPDGLFADQVVESDVVDLRHGSAQDLSEVLDKNFQYVLDNTLRSQGESFTDGLSTVGGTSFTVGDDIGAISTHIGSPDGVRAHFSDRRVTEPAIHWAPALVAATSLTINLSSVNLPWAPATNVALNAPTGTKFTGVGKIRLIGPSFATPTFDNDFYPSITSIVVTDTTVTLNFSVTTGDLAVELLITYPPAVGIRRNVLEAHDLWTPDPATLPAWANNPARYNNTGLPPGRFRLEEGFPLRSQPGGPGPITQVGPFWWVDIAHRELTLFSPSIPWASFSPSLAGGAVVNAQGTVLIPDRIAAIVDVGVVSPPGITVVGIALNGAYTELTLSPPQAPGTQLTEIDYVPYRPPPPVGSDHYTLWYRSRAVQSVDPPAGTQTLNLTPRCFSKYAHVITNGSGSPDDGFPYDAVGAQIPIPTQPPGAHPEAIMDSPNNVSVTGFGMNSGYAQVPVLMPYSPNPGQVTIYRDAVDGVLDGDGRRFWPRSDDGSVPAYSPTVYGQSLTVPTRHKVAYPIVCELKEDFNSIGQKGTMVLVVFCSWAEISMMNGVAMSSIPGDSGAAVFKLKGGLLNPRRSQ